MNAGAAVGLEELGSESGYDSRRRFYSYDSSSSYPPRRRYLYGGSNSYPSYLVPRRRRTVVAGSPSHGSWKDNVQRVNVKAQAYTAGALRNINTGAARGMMLKWF